MLQLMRENWKMQVIETVSVVAGGEVIGTANQIVTVNGNRWYANHGDVLYTSAGYGVLPDHSNVEVM